MLSVALPYCAMNEKKNEVFIMSGAGGDGGGGAGGGGSGGGGYWRSWSWKIQDQPHLSPGIRYWRQ